MLRDILEDTYGKEVSDHIRVIYGGSANKENAGVLASSDQVDGLFIGRFGHVLDNFLEIVETVHKIKFEKEEKR